MFAVGYLICTAIGTSPDALSAKSLASFSQVDAAVRAMPAPGAPTVASVAKGLAALAPSPAARARAAYQWTTLNVAYSLDRRFSPQATLTARSGDCDAHSALYTALCTAMSVECKTLGGHLRYATAPGSALAQDSKSFAPGQWLVTHSWNAVRIDGRWGLVDTTLGVRADRNAAQPDDYFLVDPSVFATDHVSGEASAELARMPLIRPIAWRMGFQASDLAPEIRRDADGVTLHASLTWRRGMRTVLQNEGGGVANGALVQPSDTGTELRLRPRGPGTVAWLGFGTGAAWRPLAGYPVTGSFGRLPTVTSRFYDSGASLQGPFDHDLRVGKTTEIRLRAPGASQVVAFQGEDVAGSFSREGDVWVLRTSPSRGAALEVMASYDDPNTFQGLVTYGIQ